MYLNMKLQNSIKIISLLQILLYVWAVLIIYSAKQQTANPAMGLGAFVPLGLFVVFGLLNIVLFYRYFIRRSEQHENHDYVLYLLLAVVVTITGLTPVISSYLDKM